jgi:hypothetical protein
VQEYGKVLADLFVSECIQFIRRGAHDAPVPLTNGESELFVTNGATNQINLHRIIVALTPSAATIKGRYAV